MSTVAAITAVQIAAGAAVVGAAASIKSGIDQQAAASEQRKTEEKARKVSNARTRLENQKSIRQRIAAQRIEEGELVQGAEAGGVAGSSSLFGSVGSSQSSASGDIGFANARIAANQGASDIRSAGARRAGGLASSAATFGTIANVSSLFQNSQNNAALGKLIT
jgi:hypothetical protein